MYSLCATEKCSKNYRCSRDQNQSWNGTPSLNFTFYIESFWWKVFDAKPSCLSLLYEQRLTPQWKDSLASYCPCPACLTQLGQNQIFSALLRAAVRRVSEKTRDSNFTKFFFIHFFVLSEKLGWFSQPPILQTEISSVLSEQRAAGISFYNLLQPHTHHVEGLPFRIITRLVCSNRAFSAL